MQYFPPPAANPYIRGQISSATPIQLVVILYDGVISFLTAAQEGFRMSDPISRNETINNNLLRAQNVIQELNAVLDHEQGPEFARQMQGVYEFLVNTLIRININKTNDSALNDLVRVQTVVTELRDAWGQISNPNKTTQPQPQAA